MGAALGAVKAVVTQIVASGAHGCVPIRPCLCAALPRPELVCPFLAHLQRSQRQRAPQQAGEGQHRLPDHPRRAVLQQCINTRGAQQQHLHPRVVHSQVAQQGGQRLADWNIGVRLGGGEYGVGAARA